MLPEVNLNKKSLEEYGGIAPAEIIKEIKALKRNLRGFRAVHINATPVGGGVAEMLQSLVPLMRDVGLDAHWYVLPVNSSFFRVTKKIHNSLQGKPVGLSLAEKNLYLAYNKKIAGMMRGIAADCWIIHDPQPAGVVRYFEHDRPFFARIHIDTSAPHPKTLEFLSQFWVEYDRILFTLPEFVPQKFPKNKIRILHPAIDPLSHKNKAIHHQAADRILTSFGVNPARPIVAQVSRFDPWKDPIGVIRAYRIAKKSFPELQLILVGLAIAQDDPEAALVLKKVKANAKNDPDIFLFSDLAQIGALSNDLFVNAVQVGADVILQKSIREGYGLTVTEAMWKGRPVIGGNVGGIKIQIKNGVNGFLVNNAEEAALCITMLLKRPHLRRKIGTAAKEYVRRNFLIPRLLRDYLRLFTEFTAKG